MTIITNNPRIIAWTNSIMIGETSDVGRVITSSPFFKCPRVHPCECGGIHEDPAPFSILPGGSVDSTLLQMEPSLMPGCGDPRIKGFQIELTPTIADIMLNITDRVTVGMSSGDISSTINSLFIFCRKYTIRRKQTYLIMT
ncbi:uncharacterized protein LOC124314798 isoform X2 [Daphnia pulicaria]|uniref:uncharacterized protein LOC124314798 isoform X2 n=1 Tax=Daphnia pulicaria TaxID=35523 RepID=UPI001EEBCFF2|nr:uncharacterized protein LOC124314798 isoform X2 [Daphnia pulicaria]